MTNGLLNAIDKALAKEGKVVKFTGDSLSDIVIEGTKQPKYKVAPVNDRTVDGIVFDSKGEMQRYLDLVLLFKAGEISNLAIQPEFTLQDGYRDEQGKYIRPIKYIADFSYYDNGKFIVEDFKGHRTTGYLMKRKMFMKVFPKYEFRETGTDDIV